MSTPKPHRRLALTRPTGSPAVTLLEPTDGEQVTADAARLALLEARCARLEELLSGLSEESASFQLVNGAGGVVTEVRTDADGATLQLLNAEGEPSSVVSVETGGSALTLLNGSGCVVGAVVLSPSDGRVVVRHPDGNPAVILESSRPTGALEVRTSDATPPAARVSVLPDRYVIGLGGSWSVARGD